MTVAAIRKEYNEAKREYRAAGKKLAAATGLHKKKAKKAKKAKKTKKARKSK